MKAAEWRELRMDGREKEEWRIAAQADEAKAEAEMLSLKEAEIGLDDTAF